MFRYTYDKSKPWREVFDTAVRIHELQEYQLKRNDFVHMYLMLENIGKDYIASGLMFPDEKYEIPLNNGDKFEISFANDKAVLDLITLTGDRHSLVSEKDSAAHEYSKLTGYELSGIGIGRQYPKDFDKVFLEDMHVGDVISFDNRDVVYACVGETPGSRTMKRVYLGKDKLGADISKFKDAPERTYYAQSLQDFYDDVKTAAGNVFPHIEKVEYFAQPKINSFYKLLNEKVGRFKCGNETFVAKKAFLSKNIQWYDSTGKKIDEGLLKAYMAWVHSGPVNLTLKHVDKGCNLTDCADEFRIRRMYELHLIAKDYAKAVGYLQKMSVKYAATFEISLDSIGINGPETYIFSMGHIAKVCYGKDQEAEQIQPLTQEDLAGILAEKYSNCHEVAYEETLRTYGRDIRSDKGNAEVKKMAEKRADLEVTMEKHSDAEHISVARDDIAALVARHFEEKEIEDPGDGYDWAE